MTGSKVVGWARKETGGMRQCADSRRLAVRKPANQRSPNSQPTRARYRPACLGSFVLNRAPGHLRTFDLGLRSQSLASAQAVKFGAYSPQTVFGAFGLEHLDGRGLGMVFMAVGRQFGQRSTGHLGTRDVPGTEGFRPVRPVRKPNFRLSISGL